MGAGRVLATLLALVIASGTAIPGSGQAHASLSGPQVIPFPGTPDASPRSQIIFSALRPSQLRSVSVVGTRSGHHAGRLIALPGGSGTAFVPRQLFTSPESVQVAAVVDGDRGSTRLAFSFRVSAPLRISGVAHSTGTRASAAAVPARTSSAPPVQRYRSAPRLHPPVVQVTSDPDRRSGDIFLTPEASRGQHGPMILDSQGKLVWFRRVAERRVYNLEVRSYERAPVLTWWEGRVMDGHGVDGEDMIVNRSYRTVATLHAGYGYSSDLHEFQLTTHGTALIDAYVPVRANLSSRGGPSNGIVYDCVIQELDVRTGRVLWEWHSLGHVPLSASYARVPRSGAYDYFHLNSIQRLPDGNLLVSARQTWGVYLIDKHTGRIIWTLGGKYSSFHVAPGARFEWQHHATLHPHGLLTVFDDAIREERESSAKVLRINGANRTVSLMAAYHHSPPLVTGVEGSAQLLANRNMLVGWGNTPEFSEYSPDGRQIFNGSFIAPVSTYRVYRFGWHGEPKTRPALALARGKAGGVKLFVSWNGATDVAAWRVLGGPSARSLRPLIDAKPRGFETTITVHSGSTRFAVQALDRRGRVLGSTRIRST
jgi:Arylsulfotransferase (ASST)